MTITVELPEDIAIHLSAMGENLSRAALEGLGLEQYRAGKLSQAQLRRLLGLATRMELDGFLKATASNWNTVRRIWSVIARRCGKSAFRR